MHVDGAAGSRTLIPNGWPEEDWVSGSTEPIRGARVLSVLAVVGLIAALAVAVSSPAAAQDGRTLDLRVLVITGDVPRPTPPPSSWR